MKDKEYLRLKKSLFSATYNLGFMHLKDKKGYININVDLTAYELKNESKDYYIFKKRAKNIKYWKIMEKK